MSDKLTAYRGAEQPIPASIRRWHLRGAGLDALSEESIPMPQFGPHELLVRHDACGICFSDIKIINLGPEHPRLQGRDMEKNPVVMGHEVALTIVGVGDDLKDRFHIGERYIVQADVYYQKANVAYGYQLDGGMAQYGVVTKEVIEGDEGCYLIPIKDDTGYVEAALVEPWACVVAAYGYNNYRDGLLDGGRLLVVADSGEAETVLNQLITPGHQPAQTTNISQIAPIDELRAHSSDKFDDIVVVGSPSAIRLADIASMLGKNGILLLVSPKPVEGAAPFDVGRIHYDQHLFIGTADLDNAAAAYRSNTRRDIKAGGSAWLIGAGGPMGQMHLQRTVMMPNPPRRVIVTDMSDERLERIQERFGKVMADREIELVKLNPTRGDDPASYGPFDDIICLVPVPAIISESVPLLARDGLYNIFAGVARGVTAEIGMAAVLAKNGRLVGTSGSTIDDLKTTLALVESDELSTNASLAAIGGLDVFRDGLAAVKAGQFPGKTVIFPQIPDLPLTSIEEMKTSMPGVYEKLQHGLFWTAEAETELLEEYLKV